MTRTKSLHIGHLRRSDHGSAVDLDLEFRDGWSDRELEKYRSRPDSFILGAKVDDEVIGYVAYRLTGSDRRPKIILDRLAVRRLHRRQGIGSALLVAAVRSCPGALVLTKVSEHNRSAIEFFGHRGFLASMVNGQIAFARKV